MKEVLRTIRGYDFYEVSSSLQKAIRRNDAAIAGYMALELWHSNFSAYLWKKLFTISAEDCHGIITKEIEALYNGYMFINEGKKVSEHKGRIFISKAVILLCQSLKSRDADHLQNLIYDKKEDPEFNQQLESYFDIVRKENIPIPDYAYDCHTYKGKKMGKTKEDFFREEFKGLSPNQPGLFDDLIQ